MKKRSAILAIVVTCAALLILAAQTQAITPVAAHQLDMMLLPTSTATLLPTPAPETFTMNGAITFHAPNDVFTIKIPKSWKADAPNGTNFFTFSSGDTFAMPQASLVIELIDKVELTRGLDIDPAKTTPLSVLQTIKKQQFSTAPSTTLSQVFSARVGNLNGAGLTVTTRDRVAQVVDLRLAEIDKDHFMVVFFSTYEQYLPKAKPVFDRMLSSLVVRPKNIPTVTPTFTATPVTPTPTLVVTQSAFNDLPQSVSDDGSPIVGNPNAEVTILEFVDFSCPHCRVYQPVMRQVLDKYVRGGDAKIIVRFMRFVGGSFSETAAAAAVCAAKQGHFLDMEEALFSVEEQQTYEAYTTETIREVSGKLKLDVDKLMTCLRDPDTLATLTKDEAVASELGLGSVPTIFYATDGVHFQGVPGNGGAPVPQPSFEDLSKAIEGAIDAGGTKL